MKDITELTETTDVTAVTKEKWSKDIEAAAGAKRVFRPLIKYDESLAGAGAGDILHVPRRGTLTISPLTEGTAIPTDVLKYEEAATLEPKYYGTMVGITTQAKEAAYPNLIRGANTEIGEAWARFEDQTIGSAICNGCVTNVIYAGGGTCVDDLKAGDTLNPALIARAKMMIESADFSADYAVMHPRQSWQLGTADIFKASYFGSREYVEKGMVSQYLGMSLFSTTNVPGGTNAGTIGYHAVLVFNKTRSCVEATKGPLKVETDRDLKNNQYLIAGQGAIDVQLLNEDSCAVIYCADE